jgi:hypothetical protein
MSLNLCERLFSFNFQQGFAHVVNLLLSIAYFVEYSFSKKGTSHFTHLIHQKLVQLSETRKFNLISITTNRGRADQAKFVLANIMECLITAYKEENNSQVPIVFLQKEKAGTFSVFHTRQFIIRGFGQ